MSSWGKLKPCRPKHEASMLPFSRPIMDARVVNSVRRGWGQALDGEDEILIVLTDSIITCT